MLDLKHLLEHKVTADKKQTKPNKLESRKSYSPPRRTCRGILPGIPWLFHVWVRSGASCCRISPCGSLSKLWEVEAVWCSEVRSSLHHISEPTRPLSVDYWSDHTAAAAPLLIPLAVRSEFRAGRWMKGPHFHFINIISLPIYFRSIRVCKYNQGVNAGSVFEHIYSQHLRLAQC